jgi:hypothetical protein
VISLILSAFLQVYALSFQMHDVSIHKLPSRRSKEIFSLRAAPQKHQPSSSTAVDKSSSSTSCNNDQQERRVALLLCPAQFCVPDDYAELWQTLPSQIEVESDNDVIIIDRELSRVVPLSRRDWIKVSKQLPSREFWNANLNVHKTLDWYFEAIEDGLAQILYREDLQQNVDVCLVGHSIGGWVARAFLGGLSR